MKGTSWSVSFCNKKEFQVEMSREIVLWQIFVDHRSAWFPLLSACRLVEFDISVLNLPSVCVVKAHFYSWLALSRNIVPV